VKGKSRGKLFRTKGCRIRSRWRIHYFTNFWLVCDVQLRNQIDESVEAAMPLPGAAFLLPGGRPLRGLLSSSEEVGCAGTALVIQAGGRPRRFAPPSGRRSIARAQQTQSGVGEEFEG
jgi:hypothetical protein